MTPGYCGQAQADARTGASEMIWMNLKPEDRHDNVFYATILATGTLIVQLSVLVELLPVEEGDVDDEGEEETRLIMHM